MQFYDAWLPTCILDCGNPFQLAPAAWAVGFSKPSAIPDGDSAGDHFDAADLA